MKSRRNRPISRRRTTFKCARIDVTRVILLIGILQCLTWILYSHKNNIMSIHRNIQENTVLPVSSHRLGNQTSANANESRFALSNQSSSSSLSSMEIQPFRTQADKDFAQTCLRIHHRGSVYFKHHRKAGGTTILRNIIRREVCPQKIEVFDSERPFFNATAAFGEKSLLPKSSTVFITVLRDPIERILSMYWFEGRWPRTCSLQCEAKKTKDNSTKVADLGEWVDAVYHQTNINKFRLKKHTTCGQWQSVENYYIRQLLGDDRGETGDEFMNNTLTPKDLHRAKQILASFDLVLIQEEYNRSPNMVKMLRSIVGSTSNNTILGQARQGLERKDHFEPPSMNELRRLQELNRLDIELYEYARNLSRETVNNWVERETQKTAEIEIKADDCEIISEDSHPEKQDINIIGGRGCQNAQRYLYGGAKCVRMSNDPHYRVGLKDGAMAVIQKLRLKYRSLEI